MIKIKSNAWSYRITTKKITRDLLNTIYLKNKENVKNKFVNIESDVMSEVTMKKLIDAVTLKTSIEDLAPKYVSDYDYLYKLTHKEYTNRKNIKTYRRNKIGSKIWDDAVEYCNKKGLTIVYASELYKVYTMGLHSTIEYEFDSQKEAINSIEYVDKYPKFFSGLSKAIKEFVDRSDKLSDLISIDKIKEFDERTQYLYDKKILYVSIKDRYNNKLSSEAIISKMNTIKKFFGTEVKYNGISHVVENGEYRLLVGEKPVYDEFMSAGFELVDDVRTDYVLDDKYIICLDKYVRAEKSPYPYIMFNKKFNSFSCVMNKNLTINLGNSKTKYISFGEYYDWAKPVVNDFKSDIARLFAIKPEYVDDTLIYFSSNKSAVLDYIDVVGLSYENLVDILKNIYDFTYVIYREITDEEEKKGGYITNKVEFCLDRYDMRVILDYLQRRVEEGSLRIRDDEVLYEDSTSDYSISYNFEDEEAHENDVSDDNEDPELSPIEEISDDEDEDNDDDNTPDIEEDK